MQVAQKPIQGKDKGFKKGDWGRGEIMKAGCLMVGRGILESSTSSNDLEVPSFSDKDEFIPRKHTSSKPHVNLHSVNTWFENYTENESLKKENETTYPQWMMNLSQVQNGEPLVSKTACNLRIIYWGAFAGGGSWT